MSLHNIPTDEALRRLFRAMDRARQPGPTVGDAVAAAREAVEAERRTADEVRRVVNRAAGRRTAPTDAPKRAYTTTKRARI